MLLLLPPRLLPSAPWAPTRLLCPPWPRHRAPGGRCAALWRVFLWSSLCSPTKPLSRCGSSAPRLLPATCSAAPETGNRGENKRRSASVSRADGKRTTWWRNWTCSWICCSRTEWVGLMSNPRADSRLVRLDLMTVTLRSAGKQFESINLLFSDVEMQRGAVCLQ